VIYKSNREWHIDAPSLKISEAHIKAERCMRALYLQSRCKKDTVMVYELSVVSHLCSAMLHGLHNNQSHWQQYMDSAASILNTKKNVSMASIVSDSNEDIKKAEYDPYLFIISNNMQTGQHYLDTIQLCNGAEKNDMGIVHKISKGKPHLYINQADQDYHTMPQGTEIIPQHTAAVA
jgi:hypothetical protein